MFIVHVHFYNACSIYNACSFVYNACALYIMRVFAACVLFHQPAIISLWGRIFELSYDNMLLLTVLLLAGVAAGRELGMRIWRGVSAGGELR